MDAEPTPPAGPPAQPEAVRTVLELDLASYSDIARLLEENLDIHAVKAFEDQVQAFVDAGLAAVGLRRDEVVLGTAGDNAILVFDDVTRMHGFTEAVHRAVAAHNAGKALQSARRFFRMGAATGPVLVLEAQRRIVGFTVARAVRLEAAAAVGQVLVDAATYDRMPADLRPLYGPREVVRGKRNEAFHAHRRTLERVAVPFPWRRAARAAVAAAAAAGIGVATWLHARPDPPPPGPERPPAPAARSDWTVGVGTKEQVGRAELDALKE